jgi:hypothetical protein
MERGKCDMAAVQIGYVKWRLGTSVWHDAGTVINSFFQRKCLVYQSQQSFLSCGHQGYCSTHIVFFTIWMFKGTGLQYGFYGFC